VQPAVPATEDWRAATQAGVAYTAGVFVVAFALGTIRVMFVAPRVGNLLAVLLEAPIVLAVSWPISMWCARRFDLGSDARQIGRASCRERV
jgi:hypothetical protein